MATPATKLPASLVPSLTDAADRKLRYPLTSFDKDKKCQAAALREGDLLHLKAEVLGFPKGEVLPVYGCCVSLDADTGEPYRVVAYVRGGSESIGYAERDFAKYPSAENTESWFGSFLLFLTEIDLTDYADSLRLERRAVAAELPLSSAIEVSHRSAA